MACCICNKAGHDEQLHGEEGEEILELRARCLRYERALRLILEGKRRLDVISRGGVYASMAGRFIEVAKAALSEGKPNE